jgi:hypothetical protein
MKTLSKTSRFLIVLGLLTSALPAFALEFDLVISNGRVMDPESGLDAIRNIGVKDGRIAVITGTELTGMKTIDATGHVVAPGFIDLHVHGQDPYATRLMLRDGVTSPLEIEAGAYPIETFYDERKGKSLANYGVSVSHIWARIAVMDDVDPKGLGLYTGAINAAARDGAKWSTRQADADQLKTIMSNVEKGLRQGGLGIGMPIGYYTAAGSPELVAIATLAKRYDSFITSHVRYLSQIEPSGYLGIVEFLAIAAMNDIPLILHHVPSNCMGATKRCLDLIDEARDGGLKVAGEFYPYTYGSSVIGADYLAAGFQDATGMDYSDITYLKTGEKLTEATWAKYRKEDPGRMMLMHHIKKPEMLEAFRREGVFVGADGMPFFDKDGKIPASDAALGAAQGHPRGAGTHAKILRMVREENVIPLMEAIAKLGYQQAKFLEDKVPDMKVRGRLKPGAIADITIFDPATVTDHAEWAVDKYSLPSTGIPWVIVNGIVTVADSKVLPDVFAGQPIRNAVLD